MWNGANDPQEFVVDEVRAADFEPVDASDLAFGETDGGVSINAVAVAKRLNDLLVLIQQLEATQHEPRILKRGRPLPYPLDDIDPS